MIIGRFFINLIFNNLKFLLGGEYRTFIIPLTPYRFFFINRSIRIVCLPSVKSYSTITEIFFNRQYIQFAKTINEVLLTNEKDDLAIFDIGANIGLFEVFLSQHLSEKVQIFCYEPAETNFKLLYKNTRSDTISTLKAVSSSKFRYALSAMEGDDVRINYAKDNKFDITIAFEEEFIANKKSINFVKVDIEGHEYELFKCNTNWLNDVKLICVEFHDHLCKRHTSKTFLKALNTVGQDVRMTYNDNMIWLSKL